MKIERVVITTLNGNIIDHRIFEDQRQAYAGYSESVNKMRSILQNSNDDGDWEILLCDVKQYALSRPNEGSPKTTSDEDWYGKFLSALAKSTHRMATVRQKWNLGMWMRLKRDVDATDVHKDEQPNGGTGP